MGEGKSAAKNRAFFISWVLALIILILTFSVWPANIPLFLAIYIAAFIVFSAIRKKRPELDSRKMNGVYLIVIAMALSPLLILTTINGLFTPEFLIPLSIEIIIFFCGFALLLRK